MTDEPTITREQFIERWVRASGFVATVEGEVVNLPGPCQWYALRCRCGEGCCDGWAMIPSDGRGWHMYNNALPGEGPTRLEADLMDSNEGGELSPEAFNGSAERHG